MEINAPVIKPMMTNAIKQSIQSNKTVTTPTLTPAKKSIGKMLLELDRAEQRIGVPISEELREIYIVGGGDPHELSNICSLSQLEARDQKRDQQ